MVRGNNKAAGTIPVGRVQSDLSRKNTQRHLLFRVPLRRLHICWFKRDLRVDDNRALHAAAAGVRADAEQGRAASLICLYCFEPTLLNQPEHDPSHAEFVRASLRELRGALRKIGSDLAVRFKDMPAALDEFDRPDEIGSLHAHQETGLAASYERDKSVARWCSARSIPFVEHQQHGVVRPLASRDGWARRWDRRMAEPCADAPRELPPPPPGLRVGRIPSLRSLNLPRSERDLAQPAGEREGLATLDSFLEVRSRRYRTAMSSPVTAADECSRLSAHLAYGTVSLRRVHQRTQNRAAEVGDDFGPRSEWALSMRSFAKRLRWHCHFMQKLEDEPSIEFHNFSRAYDGLRTEDSRHWTDQEHERFRAWAEGRTGYPMIDACMRCLHRTGWINFRMRAMLVSFAAYHLWLHWRPVAQHLARVFLDYEPGIHYSQCQMQSGTTGINTVRIYSPIKQVADQDPSGVFIRRWLPELTGVPDENLAEPHRMDPMTQHFARCAIGEDYPAPIVDHRRAYKEARDRIFSLRKNPAARAEADRVQRKHGSRRRPRQPRA